MSANKKYIAGTRGSLLALTQTKIFLNELKEKNPDIDFEIKSVVTTGDKITDRPLHEIEGNSYFTRELDKSLIDKEVDLVIHSYKDIGKERPKELYTAAIPKRIMPQDILLIKQSTIDSLSSGKTLLIGTSSPRRQVNLNEKLLNILPDSIEKLEFKDLRGNINNRIGKLQNDKYDAIVLAFAGVERLARLNESKSELKKLFEGLNFIILPVTLLPPASSQGALCIETLKSAPKHLKDAIAKLHCAETEKSVTKEREIFHLHGGHCHLPLGVHTRILNGQELSITMGEVDFKKILKYEYDLEIPFNIKKCFIGNRGKNSKNIVHDCLKIITEEDFQISFKSHVFCSSSHALKNINKDNIVSLWASGLKTMKALCNKGLWVNGMSDFKGEAEINDLFKTSKLLNLIYDNKIQRVSLTNNPNNTIFGTGLKAWDTQYKKPNKSELETILECDTFFWFSPEQIDYYFKIIPSLKNKNHISGMGKTGNHLTKLGIKHLKVPSYSYFTNILKSRGIYDNK